MFDENANPINELLDKPDSFIPVAKTKPDMSLTDLVKSMVASANAEVHVSRRVAVDEALDVAERSLARTLLLPDVDARVFAMVREVSDFLNTAVTGKQPTLAREHTDLLRVGHPLSTAHHELSNVEVAQLRSEWIAGDSRISEELRPVVASAFLTVPESPERQFSVTRLESADAQDVPRDVVLSLIAFGNPFAGGNSFLARSARAKLQRRDRLGRFAFMGGAARTFLRLASGFIKPVSARFVGGDPSTDTFDLEISDPDLGVGIITVPTGSTVGMKALIGGKLGEILAKRAKPKSATYASKYAVDAASLKLKPAPFGWRVDEADPSLFVSADGYSARKFDKLPDLVEGAEVIGFNSDKSLDSSKPVFELKNSNGDVLGYYQSWGDIQASAGRMDVKSRNKEKREAPKATEELWGDQPKGDHPESFVEDKPVDPKFGFSFYRSKKNVDGRGGFTVRRWNPDKYEPVLEFINDPKRFPKDVEVRGLRDGSSKIEPDEDLFELTSHPVPQEAAVKPPRIVGYAQDWDDIVAMSEAIEGTKPPVPAGTVQVDSEGRQFTWVYRPAMIVPQVGYMDEGWEKAYIVPKSYISGVPVDETYDGSPVEGTPDRRPSKRPYPGFEWSYVPPVEGEELGKWVQVPRYDERDSAGLESVTDVDEDGKVTERRPRPVDGSRPASRPRRPRLQPEYPNIIDVEKPTNYVVPKGGFPNLPTTPKGESKPITLPDGRVIDPSLFKPNPNLFRGGGLQTSGTGDYSFRTDGNTVFGFSPQDDVTLERVVIEDKNPLVNKLHDAAPSLVVGESLDSLSNVDNLSEKFDAFDAGGSVAWFFATEQQIAERDRFADVVSAEFGEMNGNVAKRIRDEFGDSAFDDVFDYLGKYKVFCDSHFALRNALMNHYINDKKMSEADAKKQTDSSIAAKVNLVDFPPEVIKAFDNFRAAKSAGLEAQKRGKPIHQAIGTYKREEYVAALKRAGVEMYDGDGSEVFEFDSSVSPELRAAAANILKFYPKQVVKGLEDKVAARGQKLKIDEIPDGGRAAYYPEKFTVRTNKSTNTYSAAPYESIAFHEVTHVLEDVFPELRTMAFLNTSERMVTRDADGKPVLLTDADGNPELQVVNLNGSPEYGISDMFLNPYQGRIYENKGHTPLSGGESVTMNMEQLAGFSEYFPHNPKIVDAVKNGEMSPEDVLLGNSNDNRAMFGLMVMLSGSSKELPLSDKARAWQETDIGRLSARRRMDVFRNPIESPVATTNLSVDDSSMFADDVVQSDGFASEAPSKPRSNKYVDGMDIRNQILAEASRIAYHDGRFPIPRPFKFNADISDAVKAQYSDVFLALRVDKPEFMSRFESFDDFWGELKKNGVTTFENFSNREQSEFRQTVNNAYAKYILGLDEDGFIEVYRNSYQGGSREGASQADAAAGYVSLDRNMAWDYQSQRQGANEFAGRYSIKVTPSEFGGIIGYSEAMDEFGAVLGKNVTGLDDRVVRHGDLAVLPSPSFENVDRGSGDSPYRRFLNGFRYIQPAGEFDYTSIPDLIERVGGRDVIRAKILEMFPNTTFDRQNDDSFALNDYIFGKFITRTSEGKAVLNPAALSLATSGSGVRGDDVDNFLKGALAFQELTGQPIMQWKLSQKPQVDDMIYSPVNTPSLDGGVSKPEDSLFGDYVPESVDVLPVSDDAVKPSKTFGRFFRSRKSSTNFVPSIFNSDSPKARSVMQRISKVKNVSRPSLSEFADTGESNPFNIRNIKNRSVQAEYVTEDGTKYNLVLDESLIAAGDMRFNTGGVTVFDKNNEYVGFVTYSDQSQKLDDVAPINRGEAASWGGRFAIIGVAHVEDEHQRKGLATAALEFARSQSKMPIYHSFMLSNDGSAFSSAIHSPLPTPDLMEDISDYSGKSEKAREVVKRMDFVSEVSEDRTSERSPSGLYKSVTSTAVYTSESGDKFYLSDTRIGFPMSAKEPNDITPTWGSVEVTDETGWVIGSMAYAVPGMSQGKYRTGGVHEDAVADVDNTKPFATIEMIEVDWNYTRQGLATAMLELARSNKELPMPIYHSSSRTPYGTSFSNAVQSPVPTPSLDVMDASNTFAGLTEKSRDVASRLKRYGDVKTTKSEVTGLTTTTSYASYVSDGGNFYLIQEVAYSGDNGLGVRQLTAYSEDGEEIGLFRVSKVKPDADGTYSLSVVDPRHAGEVDTSKPFYTVSFAHVNEDNQRQGVATAMLEFARMNSDAPIHHSSILSAKGSSFADRVYAPVATPELEKLSSSDDGNGLPLSSDKAREVAKRMFNLKYSVTSRGEDEDDTYFSSIGSSRYRSPDGRLFGLVYRASVYVSKNEPNVRHMNATINIHEINDDGSTIESNVGKLVVETPEFDFSFDPTSGEYTKGDQIWDVDSVYAPNVELDGSDPNIPNVVDLAIVYSEKNKRLGLATAALELARKFNDGVPVYHSSSRSPEGKQFAEAAQAPVATPSLDGESVDAASARPYDLKPNKPRAYGSDYVGKFSMFNNYDPEKRPDFGEHSQVLSASSGNFPSMDGRTATAIYMNVRADDSSLLDVQNRIENDPEYPRIPDDEIWKTAQELPWVQQRGYKSAKDIPQENLPELVARTLGRWSDDGDPQLADYLKRENNFVQQKLNEHVMPDGKKVGDVLDSIANDALRELGDISSNEDVELYMPLGRLKKMIDDGRFKTVYETTRNNKSGTRDQYMEVRESIEYMMGVPESTIPSQRPVYGVIGEVDANLPVQYGDTKIVFKDEIKNRTSLTLGDSMDGGSGAYWMSDLIDQKINPEEFWKKSGGNVHFNAFNENSGYFNTERASGEYIASRILGYDPKPVDKLAWGGHGYIETQIHGGVTLNDIAKVIVPKSSSLTREERAKLNSLGILIEVNENA